MSTQYETQGYTINNAGRRLVVDPITRIEGHMRCEVNINDQNVITNAVSCVCRPNLANGDSNDSNASVMAVGVVEARNITPMTMTTANRHA